MLEAINFSIFVSILHEAYWCKRCGLYIAFFWAKENLLAFSLLLESFRDKARIYLRERLNSIDLWQVIVYYSVHKNFTIFDWENCKSRRIIRHYFNKLPLIERGKSTPYSRATGLLDNDFSSTKLQSREILTWNLSYYWTQQITEHIFICTDNGWCDISYPIFTIISNKFFNYH